MYSVKHIKFLKCVLCVCVEKKNQLDATEWFIALLICSTCFGHFYAHHQELETICVCYYRLWCAMSWLVVVGGQMQVSRLCVRNEGCCSRNIPHPERIACCSVPDLRPPATKASHTIGGNKTYSLELLMMGVKVPETC